MKSNGAGAEGEINLERKGFRPMEDVGVSKDHIEEFGFGLMSIVADKAMDVFWNGQKKQQEKSGIKGEDVMNNNKKGDTLHGNAHLPSNKEKQEMSTKTYSDYKNETKSILTLHENGETIREMKIYEYILKSVKKQCDSYIMGHNLDSIRDKAVITNPMQSETKANLTQYNNFLPLPTYQIHSNSLAYKQITDLAQWFIPSPTMHNFLHPYVIFTLAPPRLNGINYQMVDQFVAWHKGHWSM